MFWVANWLTLLSIPTIAFSVYLFPSIYLSLFGSIMIGYLLSPIVELVNLPISKILPRNPHLSWNISCVLTIALFIYILVILIWLLFPVIHEQIVSLYSILSKEESYRKTIDTIIFWLGNNRFPGLESNLLDSIRDLLQNDVKSLANIGVSKIVAFAQDLSNRGLYMVKSIISSFHNILNFMLTFVLSFHILREWKLWPKRIDSFCNHRLIKPYSRGIKVFTGRVDIGIKNWIRGQILTTLILSGIYSIGFMYIGVPAPIAMGFLFGFVSYIPYIGDIIGFGNLGIAATYAGLSVFQIVLSVLLVFAGHALAGYVLLPALIGRHTGLHTVQMITGFMLHSRLFGLVGVFFNVPLCVLTNAILFGLIANSSDDVS